MKMSLSQVLRLHLRWGLCFALAGTLSGKAGTVIGNVNDVNTGSSITGAVVTDHATGNTVYADREGQFRMDNLPGGSATLTISAAGYPDKTQVVEVPATGVVSIDVPLGEKVVKLGQLVVEGYREGWSKAQQQEKNATNFKDVLSSDAAGNLPDNNVAEALSRLPGISLDVDYGEGHYVSVRGTAPNLNTVTLNGATMASPPEGGTTRSTPLDLIGTSLLNQVEVIKTPTPDMDGTSLGGTINILTPSGFDHQGQYVAGRVQYGENEAGNMPNYEADFIYSNAFSASTGGRLGLAIGANYSDRQTRRDMFMAQYQTLGGVPYMYEPRLDYNVDKRKKNGVTIDLDYRSNNGGRVYFRALYNNFDERNDKQEQLYTGAGTATFLTPTKVSQPQVRADIRYISFDRHAQSTNLILGGSKIWDDYKASFEVTDSYAPDDQPDYRNFSFRTGKDTIPGGFIIDFGKKYPSYDLSSYLQSVNPSVRRVRGDVITNKDSIYTVRGDIQRDFDNWFGDKKGFLKFGSKYTHHIRNNHRGVDVYGASGYRLSDFDTPPGPSSLQVLDGRYVLPISINQDVSRAMYQTLLSQGKLQRDDSGSMANAGDDTYKVTEKITAVYGMFSVDLSSQATLLGGIRYESTDAPMDALSFFMDPVTGAPTLALKHVTFNYGQVLPNLQLRYALSKNTIFRAAITKTFGRPEYHDQVPSSVLDEVGGVLTAGNPYLEPFDSMNYDLSLEHYFKSGGVISIAPFYKSIKHPIYTYSRTEQNITYAGYFFPTFIVSEQRNADSASLYGVEFSGQIPFSAFLEGFANGFGVDVNFSLMKSKVVVFNRPGEDLRLFDSPERLANIGIFYDKYGFAARLAYNYKSNALDSIGSGPLDDIYDSPRYFLDAQVSYRFMEHYTVFINWQNITDQTTDSYTAGNKNYLSRSYWYGSNVRAGIKFTF